MRQTNVCRFVGHDAYMEKIRRRKNKSIDIFEFERYNMGIIKFCEA